MILGSIGVTLMLVGLSIKALSSGKAGGSLIVVGFTCFIVSVLRDR